MGRTWTHLWRATHPACTNGQVAGFKTIGGSLAWHQHPTLYSASCCAQTKLRLIEIYNARLTERERRRQFILDRGLLNVKRQQVSLGV